MNSTRVETLNCFNPFKKPHHSHVRKGLRTVTPWMCALIPEMPINSKVCTICRKNLSGMKNDNSTNDLPSTSYSDLKSKSNISEDSDSEALNLNESLNLFNASLVELGESPVNRKKARYRKYSNKKIKNITSTVKRKLLRNASSSDEDRNSDSKNEILNHLKSVYENCESREKKIMILTLLPENWSIRKIIKEFKAPDFQVRQAKKLLKQKGILSTTNQKPGKNLPTETLNKIIEFYENDVVSRPMPGIKDCVSVKDKEGKKVKVSKRLMLCNLKETYKLFQENFPNIKVGFSKFAELRPKNCVLAGQSGTHTVCICTIHQNVKLMVENCKINSITNGQIKTYKDCLTKMVCNPVSIDCYFSNCASCPGVDDIIKILEGGFQENLIETLTFRQWISVDRCNLETVQKPVQEFINIFCEKLQVLLRHDFISKQQSAFMCYTKENLLISEIAVVCDFSENYSFILQDEAQSFHWNKSQATIHPFVIYFKEENEIKHCSFVIISECLEHNTIAVYTFQKKLIQFLKSKFKEVEKLYYFSDGSGAQYKNKKNFINLCHHKNDFGIVAEWHFSATAHGKGPCDGVGGTVKREAARASLQRPYQDQIMTPLHLYEWLKCNLSKSMEFCYVTQDEYVKTEQYLAHRLSKAVAIPNTRKFHAFIPSTCGTKIQTKIFSFSPSSETHTILPVGEDLDFDKLTGYLVSFYNDAWWLCYILDKNADDNELKVTFLHPPGPAHSFFYPSVPDILWISSTNVICKVNPITPTGRTYTLLPDETNKIVKMFNDYLQSKQKCV